jgi:hypothetical protein
VGFSPAFLREVVNELERVQRQLDRVDARIERAKRPATKDRFSAERAVWVEYEKFLRRVLAA